jgi:hypothetical protein
MFGRALGVTQTAFEELFVVPIVTAAALGAVRAARHYRALWASWSVLWPAALALALTGAYFVVPFELGGLAGLNERIPLFVVLLLLPYVPLRGAWERWLVWGFAAFGLYTVAESYPRDRLAHEAREAEASTLIPRGSLVYTVSLRSKLRSLSADLGLHLLADVGRQRDLVMPEVFCSHPGHVLRCLDGMPLPFNAGAVLRFEHLNEAEQRAALADPQSAINRCLDRIAEDVGRSEYLLVLRAKALNQAFDERVVAKLHATPMGASDGPVAVYRLNVRDPALPVAGPP